MFDCFVVVLFRLLIGSDFVVYRDVVLQTTVHGICIVRDIAIASIF